MKPYRFPRPLLTGLVLILAALLAGGVWYFHAKQNELRDTAEHELLAIAELKSAQIADWRADQLTKGRELMESQFLKRGVASWLNRRDAESREMILSRMRSLSTHYGYKDVLLVDPDGNVLLSLAPGHEELDEEVLAILQESYKSREALLTDIHFGRADRVLHIGVIAPLFLENENTSVLIGAFILQSDARQYLYPLIQSWPLPSKTGETLLIRQEGDEVLFLNELRHQSGTALQLRIPLTETVVPAVKAVLGESGVVEGLDYRGVPVISVVQPIPDSPWFMVAKVDRAEALAVWRTNAALIVLLLLGMGGMAAAGAGVLWQRGAKIHYLKLARAEAAQQESAEQHRLLFESMSQGVVYQDSAGLIVDANPAAERILGLTLDQMRGLTSVDPRWRSVHEDGSDFPGEAHPSSVALQTGRAVHNVVMGVFNPALNETVWINIHAMPLFHPGDDAPYQVYTTFEDISGRVRAEKALQESEAYIRHILDHLPIGVSVNSVDPTVEFDYINENFLRIYRTTREELQKPDGFWEAVYPDHNFREKLRKRVLDDIASGNISRMRWEDIPIQREGQETTYISAQNIPLADNKMMMSVVWDTTHRVRAEAEVRALNADLEERVATRTRQLEETQQMLLRQERLATLGQLAGSVSHELRNPLGVISNAVYLLGQALSQNEKAREYLNIIQAETRTADRIITDLLDFSRVKTPQRAPVALDGLVEDTLARYPAPEVIKVRVNIPPETPKLFVDGQHISQVLGNLFTNAYQAMPAGGKLLISATLLSKKGVEMVRLDVADTGEGITPEGQARLFEPLFTTKARGIGLGLPTSKNLAEMNGGWIEVSSQPGKGSTFSLFLPAARKE